MAAGGDVVEGDGVVGVAQRVPWAVAVAVGVAAVVAVLVGLGPEVVMRAAGAFG
ncbi:hypothetical protein GCM10020218_071950 [Dactylosporangium vinaceum]